MKIFSKYSISVALRALLFMLAALLLSVFLGSGALSDTNWIGWGLFAGFLLIYFIIAWMDGIDRGARDAQISARVQKLQDQGRPVDQEMLDKCFSVKKGMAIALMIAAPGLLLALLGLITMDGVVAIRAITRFYFVPFLKLYYSSLPAGICVLSYFVFALVYPGLYLVGYLVGPRQYKKQCDTIRQNEEDYKNGIRRKRKIRKRRRGLFW